MQALTYRRYGTPDVLAFETVEKPVPAAEHVLVKVHATSINAGDTLLLRGETLMTRMIAGGLRAPGRRIPGGDVAGVVEAVGSGVTRFRVGDAVYGDVSSAGFGGFAEYVSVKETLLAPKPAAVSFEQAAAVPVAAQTALQGLRDVGQIQAGQSVLITGASGGVGSFAVQLAKHFGATVTATGSTRSLAAVAALGADRVIDYTRNDITKSGLRFDLILDIAAYRPFSDYRPLLNPGGRYVLAGGAISRILKTIALGKFASMFGGKTFTNIAQSPRQDDLVLLAELIDAGHITPAIDGCYPFSKAADAFWHFSDRRGCGKVVVSMTAPAH